MPLVGLAEEEERARVVETVDRWIEEQLAEGGTLVAGEQQAVGDGRASHRWYLRLAGEEKEFVTVWLTLRQRTLHHEAQFMPAPEDHVDEVFRYLLRRNAELYGMSFSLGPEDAVYLTGRVPAALVDAEELDRVVGSSVLYVDEHFPTAMTLGHPRLYRRRPPQHRRRVRQS